MALTIRSTLLCLAGGWIVVVSYLNIWSFDKRSAELPRKFQSDVVAQEVRYEPVRELLLAAKYHGNVAFITNREVKSEENTQQDNNQWVHAQFSLIPWILVRGTRSVSGPTVSGTAEYVVGDFWDGLPRQFPAGLIKVYESNDGLLLFRRKLSE
jgi:hypothetical protein